MKQRGYVQLLLLGAGVAAVAGALWWTYSSGYDAGYDARIVEEQEVQGEQEVQEAAASTSLEGDREKVRTVYRTITEEIERVVEKPVYRDMCLDDDGLRLANAALAGALIPAREPDGRVPESAAVEERDRGSGATRTD